MTSISIQAQNTHKLNDRYFQAKVSELTMRLKMDDRQKEKFIPIYRRYSEEMRATVGVRPHPKHLTDAERLELTKRRMHRQQQAQAIRMRYVDEFATVLSAQQVSRFFEVEGEIQRKLMRRQGLGNYRK